MKNIIAFLVAVGVILAGGGLLVTNLQAHVDEAEYKAALANLRTETARQAAGLSQTTSGLTIALKSMQDSAAKDLQSAEAATAKARLLRPTKPEQDDPNIAAALAASSGKPATPTSLTDRLAALKAKA